MKKNLMFISAMAAALLLGACGGGGGETTSAGGGSADTGASSGGNTGSGGSQGTINLTVWGGEMQTSIDYLNEVGTGFTAWMKENYPNLPEVTITPSPISEASVKDEFAKDPTVAADFAICANDQLYNLVSNKYIAPLEDYGEIIDVDDITERNGANSDAATVDGKLYAFPFTGSNGYFLYYNDDLLDEEDCASFDTLLAAIDKVSTRDGKRYRFGYPTGSGWYIDGWWRAWDYDTVADEAGTYCTCEWNSTTKSPTGVEVCKSMLQYTRGQYGDHWVGAGDSTLLTYTPMTTEEPVIAWVSGTWNSSAMQTNWGKTAAAATVLPNINYGGKSVPMKSVAGLKVGVINALSTNAPYAALFGNYLTNKENSLLRYQQLNEAPTNTAANAEIDYSTNYAVGAVVEQFAHASFNQVLTDSYWSPAGTLAQCLYTGMNGDTSLVSSGDRTASVTFNDSAIQTLLNTAVSSITGKAVA